MYRYQGKTALVTGASSGIGAAFARELAARGMDLLLVARSTDRLQQLADELQARDHVHVTALPIDLSQEHAVEQIRQAVAQRGLQIDMLINNAGFATHGRFEDLELARDHAQLMVNIATLVDLTHAFIPGMLARGGGVLLNVASTVAYQPTPYMAVYGASKAFVTSFSVAPAEEYRRSGLQVLVISPGATETGFFAAAGSDTIALGRKRAPAQVV